MKVKLLIALSLFSSIVSATTHMPGMIFIDPSKMPPVDNGYIATWFYGSGGLAELEFNGETARNLYTQLPGSGVIRPDKVCSRGLKVPPTVKRIGGIRCERYVTETGQPATYRCITSIDLGTGRFSTPTEEFICGLSETEPIKTPEDEEKDFQKILSGAPPIGYQPIQLWNSLLTRKKTLIDGRLAASPSVVEFFFTGEAAEMLYESMPKRLTVSKGKACTYGAKTTPTVRRSNGLRCLRTVYKTSTDYSCYAYLDISKNWSEIASEELLCKGDPEL